MVVKEEKKCEVVQEIFGPKGLLQQNNLKDFDEMGYKLSEKYSNELPNFREYFDKITETLKVYVFRPVKDNRVPVNLKNIGCESMNYIIKMAESLKKSNLYVVVVVFV